MLKIAIVEDSTEYANLLKEKILKTDFKDQVLIDLYEDPIVLLNAMENGAEYQLCFSDIKMPGMDGIKLAEKIREKDNQMILVFLSSYLEYATEGYRVKAFDYLLKSSMDDKWDMLVNRILKQLANDKEKVYKIILQNRVVKIPVECIIYIYKEGKYCNFVVDGMEEASARKTIKEVSEELHPYKNFIQVKRGYIINIRKIRKYTAEKIIMENGADLIIGRIYVARVKEMVMRYMEGL